MPISSLTQQWKPYVWTINLLNIIRRTWTYFGHNRQCYLFCMGFFNKKSYSQNSWKRILFDNFVYHYGFPARLHSDQGVKLSVLLPTLISHSQSHTIQWVTECPRDIIRLCSTSSVLLKKITHLNGNCILLRQFAPAIQRAMRQLYIHHTISYLDDISMAISAFLSI